MLSIWRSLWRELGNVSRLCIPKKRSTMWNEIDIPPLPDQIRAYTHANDSVLFVCTSSGVFALSLGGTPKWDFVTESMQDYMVYADELVAYDKYGAINFRETYSPLHGYSTENSEGCSDIPLGQHPLSGDRLDYDHTTDRLLVIDSSNSNNIKLIVERFGASEDNWATAGFSNDGRHLTVGNLKRLLVFEYTPTQTTMLQSRAAVLFCSTAAKLSTIAGSSKLEAAL